MLTAHYLTIAFSEAQLQLEPYQKADEVKDLRDYLRSQKIRVLDRLDIFCSAEFYKRTEQQKVTGAVYIQEAIFDLTGHVFSFPDFTEGQKNAIELLGFKTDVEERFKPSLSISD